MNLKLAHNEQRVSDKSLNNVKTATAPASSAIHPSALQMAMQKPGPALPDAILQMQKIYGNQVVGAMFAGSGDLGHSASDDYPIQRSIFKVNETSTPDNTSIDNLQSDSQVIQCAFREYTVRTPRGITANLRTGSGKSSSLSYKTTQLEAGTLVKMDETQMDRAGEYYMAYIPGTRPIQRLFIKKFDIKLLTKIKTQEEEFEESERFDLKTIGLTPPRKETPSTRRRQSTKLPPIRGAKTPMPRPPSDSAPKKRSPRITRSGQTPVKLPPIDGAKTPMPKPPSGSAPKKRSPRIKGSGQTPVKLPPIKGGKSSTFAKPKPTPPISSPPKKRSTRIKRKIKPKKFSIKGKKRINKLIEATGTPLYTDEIGPGQIRQGGLGDCWLISTITAFALMQPEYLREKVLPVPEDPEKLTVYLYQPQGRGQDPQKILVTNKLPQWRKSKKLLYVNRGMSKNTPTWGAAIEKGAARQFGSYGALAKYSASVGHKMLAGSANTAQINTSASEAKIMEALKEIKDNKYPATVRRVRDTYLALNEDDLYSEREGKKQKSTKKRNHSDHAMPIVDISNDYGEIKTIDQNQKPNKSGKRTKTSWTIEELQNGSWDEPEEDVEYTHRRLKKRVTGVRGDYCKIHTIYWSRISGYEKKKKEEPKESEPLKVEPEPSEQEKQADKREVGLEFTVDEVDLVTPEDVQTEE